MSNYTCLAGLAQATACPACRNGTCSPNTHFAELAEAAIVLSDIVGDSLLKVIGWYETEWGYNMRSVDLIEKIAAL